MLVMGTQRGAARGSWPYPCGSLGIDGFMLRPQYLLSRKPCPHGYLFHARYVVCHAHYPLLARHVASSLLRETVHPEPVACGCPTALLRPHRRASAERRDAHHRSDNTLPARRALTRAERAADAAAARVRRWPRRAMPSLLPRSCSCLTPRPTQQTRTLRLVGRDGQGPCCRTPPRGDCR